MDAVLEIAKASALGALASVPVIGPVLRELVGAAWGDNRAERLQRFAVELGRDVEGLRARIDEEFVRRAEFGALAEDALERVVQRRNEQKIARFAAAVAHSSTADRPNARMRERFVDWLDMLRPIHVQILDRLVSEQTTWTRPSGAISPGQVAMSRLHGALEGLEYDPYDLRDLEGRGLIRTLEGDGNVLAAADNIANIVTPMGRAFLSFISAPPHTDPL